MAEDRSAPPPPYSLLISNSGPYRTSNSIHTSQNDVPGAARPQQLMGNIYEARARHLESIVYSFILPTVEERAVLGISHTQITLLPMLLAAKREIPAPELEAVADPYHSPANVAETVDTTYGGGEDEVVHIQLQSPIDTPRFWRQKGVLDELRRLIETALLQSHDDEFVTEVKSKEEELPARGRADKKGKSRKKEPMVVVPDRHGIIVKVDLEDVCVRTVNSFGLYETVTKEGVLVEVALER